MQSVRRYPQYRPLYKRLVTDRNTGMAQRIDAMLRKSKKVHLIVVGALHLVGREGLVPLLRGKGYALKQL